MLLDDVAIDVSDVQLDVVLAPPKGDEDPPYLTLERDDLVAALRAIKPAVAREGPLAAVRVVSDEFGACVWATNATLAARRDLEWLDGSPEGFDALVDFAELLEAAQAMGRGPMTIEAIPEGSRCCLWLTAKTTRRVAGAEPESYPLAMAWEHLPNDRLLTTNAEDLATALQRATPIASRDASRPVLCGVHLALGAACHVVALDGVELCALKIPASVRPGAQSVTLPTAAAQAIAKGLEGEHGPVTVAIGRHRTGCPPGKHVTVLLGGGELAWTVRPIDGTYPKWELLWPKQDTVCTIVTDGDELVQGAAEIAKENSREPALCARLVVSSVITGRQVYLAGTGKDGESLHESLAEADVDGDDVEVGINAELVRRCAAAVGPGRVTIKLIDTKRPIAYHNGAARALMMPIRLP